MSLVTPIRKPSGKPKVGEVLFVNRLVLTANGSYAWPDAQIGDYALLFTPYVVSALPETPTPWQTHSYVDGHGYSHQIFHKRLLDSADLTFNITAAYYPIIAVVYRGATGAIVLDTTTGATASVTCDYAGLPAGTLGLVTHISDRQGSSNAGTPEGFVDRTGPTGNGLGVFTGELADKLGALDPLGSVTWTGLSADGLHKGASLVALTA